MSDIAFITSYWQPDEYFARPFALFLTTGSSARHITRGITWTGFVGWSSVHLQIHKETT